MGRAPTLPAYRHADGVHLLVFCPACRVWHYHAAWGVKPGDGDGHRIAHCSPLLPVSYRGRGSRFRKNDSSIRDTGYFLKEMGPFTVAVRDSVKPRGPAWAVPRYARQPSTRQRRTGSFLRPVVGPFR